MEKETPIVPNEAFRLAYGDNPDDYMLVAASADSIQMFSDQRLNYLRYWDTETSTLKACWLGKEVLAALFDHGIPVTHRSSITQEEIHAHMDFCWNSAKDEYWDEMEDANILGYRDPLGTLATITEVAEEESINLDAEIEFYLEHEWKDD